MQITKPEVIGFRFFDSKKGNAMVQIFTKYDAPPFLNVTGVACESYFCLRDSLEGELYIGASIDVRYNRSGFVSSIAVL